MKTRFFALILSLVIILCSCNQNVTSLPDTSALSEEALFHFIDVGQGDCTLIQTKDATVLIDAGTSDAGTTVYNYIKNLGIDYIDCFIITHPHEDHLGGSSKITDGFDIGHIYVNGETSESFAFEKFIDSVTKNNITPEVPSFESVYNFGSLRIKFLSPTDYYEDDNDNSLVTSVEYKSTKALFMGDAEKDVENTLLQSHNIDADILKVSHHGSRNASANTFLKEVSPRVCVIQCGKDNSYGHPHKETLERLHKVCPSVLRTDEEGNIIIRSDGAFLYDTDGNEFPEISQLPDEKITYIGNKKSKVFHTEECPNLPGEKNRVIFIDPGDAELKGYKPCGNCNP